MNPDKICFIVCYNDEIYLSECILYLNQLIVPDGMETDLISIEGAESMTSGYQAGMNASDAKYKVYLHQDTFILNRNFIYDMVNIFKENPDVGMLGMVGTKKLPENAVMWDSKDRVGALRSCTLNTVDDFFDIAIAQENNANNTHTLKEVEAVDGLLMATQYDINWREDLFKKWDFYDVSQSFEFRKAGYKVAVPHQASPWVLHDCGFINFTNYYKERDIFVKEYIVC